jgi:hypothetical protein
VSVAEATPGRAKVRVPASRIWERRVEAFMVKGEKWGMRQGMVALINNTNGEKFPARAYFRRCGEGRPG